MVAPLFFVGSVVNIITVWPGWDSIDSTTTISSDAQLAAIGFFFIALIVEVFALWTENDKREKKIALVGLIFFFLCAGAEYVNSKYETRKEFLKDQQFAGELANQKKLTDKQTDAAQQQKQKTDALQSELDKQKGGTKQAQQDAANAKQDAANAKQDAANAREQTDTLRKENAPRRLSDEQKSAMINYLTGKPPGVVSFFVDINGTDGNGYAADIMFVLNKCGWQTDIKNGISMPEGGAKPDRGMHLITKEEREPLPPPSVALINSLNLAKVPFVWNYNKQQEQELFIRIEPK
jgi:hypothetical protein